ncbi:sensor histidine kinase [Cohnella yongneupensis]|uniref:histidine kinase n=1 Tax=Cohnella yongneupensis TaxID=425006 RepID=A0ABW0R8S3_9BACL
MATKWKSKRVSSILFACSILLWTFFLALLADLNKHKDFIGNYFDSPYFNREISSIMSMIAIHHIYADDFDKQSLDQRLRNELYDQLQILYGDNGANSVSRPHPAIEANRIYDSAKSFLDLSSAYIQYVVKNEQTGETYTNMNPIPADWPKNSEQVLRQVEVPISVEKYPFRERAAFVYNVSLKGTIVILKSSDDLNPIQNEYAAYQSVQDHMKRNALLLGACLIAALALSLYVRQRRAAIESNASRNIPMSGFPLDLRIIFTGIVTIVLLVLLLNWDTYGWDTRFPIRRDQIPELFVTALLTCFLFFSLRSILVLIRNPEQRAAQWQNSVIMQIRSGMEQLSLTFKFIVFTGLAALLGFIPVVALASNGSDGIIVLALLYFFVLVVIVVPYLYRKLRYLKEIMTGVEAQVSGDFTAEIPLKGEGHLPRLAANINNMKVGLQRSIEKQVVSDRLKTELITNVSHDLKTPLTSIINYVDLLKREEVTEEERAQYVEVLDRKAQRLKVLIDDLFEASKMASGAAELQLDQVDVAALLNQALGEFGDKIAASGLSFRVHIDAPHVYARLDGRKMWRVFENLISNALKYSLGGTRVYIRLTETVDTVVVSMQNISAYELSFNSDELFERFKRGDVSRHTEGSGLGLAIAKSIVELHGGKLSIVIDGDQFNVIVELRRY